jgi:hypothetical protein
MLKMLAYSKVKIRRAFKMRNLVLSLESTGLYKADFAPVVGQPAIIDGQPAPDKKYELSNGSTIIVLNGIITAVGTPRQM